MNQHAIYVIPEHQWEQEKMRGAGHQARRSSSGACSGVPTRARGSSLLSLGASFPQKHSTQRSLVPSASLSLTLPLNTILTQMWLISDSSPSSTLALL